MNLQLTHCVSMRLLGWHLFVNECGMPGLYMTFFIPSTYGSMWWRTVFRCCVYLQHMNWQSKLVRWLRRWHSSAQILKYVLQCEAKRVSELLQHDHTFLFLQNLEFMFLLFQEIYQLVVPSPNCACIFLVV